MSPELLAWDNILGAEMIAQVAKRKLAPFDDIWGKILDFRLHKFEVVSILKECALLQKSPTSEKAWNRVLYYALQLLFLYNMAWKSGENSCANICRFSSLSLRNGVQIYCPKHLQLVYHHAVLGP